jgi:hypothetical protein
MRHVTLDQCTIGVETLDELISTPNSRIKFIARGTKEIREFLAHEDEGSQKRLYYAQQGVHTGSSLITLADSDLAHLKNATVIPDFVHVLNQDKATIRDRFGSDTTFPLHMKAYGPYFGYNNKLKSFSINTHTDLNSRFSSSPTLAETPDPIFLLSNCKNDSSHGHWLFVGLPLIYRYAPLLQKYNIPLLFTYKPTRSQMEIMLTLFPWIKDRQCFVSLQPTIFTSLLIPNHVDEVQIDQNYISFLRSSIQGHSGRTKSLKIYITRDDAASRRMLNEHELIPKLETMGYLRYNISELSFVQEVELFRSASEIVYIAGAHCVNTVFCNSLARVCTIQSFDSINSTAYLLNNYGVSNIEYPVYRVNRRPYSHNEDFFINIADFIEFLKANDF